MAIETGIKPEDMNPNAASVDVAVPQSPNFEGGAEVTQDPQGGAIVQALSQALSPQQEQEPQIPHDANLAELIDEAYRGELSTELVGSYQEDLESRSEWEETYTCLL